MTVCSMGFFQALWFVISLLRHYLAASQTHASPPVHSNDLAGNVGGVGDQESYRPRYVVGLADALQGGLVDDALARHFVAPRIVVGPQYGAGGDAVHPHLGTEVARQRASERGEPALGGDVH